MKRMVWLFVVQILLLSLCCQGLPVESVDCRAEHQTGDEVVTIAGFAKRGLRLELPSQPGAFRLFVEGWFHDQCPSSSLP